MNEMLSWMVDGKISHLIWLFSRWTARRLCSAATLACWDLLRFVLGTPWSSGVLSHADVGT
jgi:hypothetical protein